MTCVGAMTDSDFVVTWARVGINQYTGFEEVWVG